MMKDGLMLFASLSLAAMVVSLLYLGGMDYVPIYFANLMLFTQMGDVRL